MSARDRFSRGQRVQMTAAAINSFAKRWGTPRTGTVVGFGREAHLVRIAVDGLKQRQSYHEQYWESIAEGR